MAQAALSIDADASQADIPMELTPKWDDILQDPGNQSDNLLAERASCTDDTVVHPPRDKSSPFSFHHARSDQSSSGHSQLTPQLPPTSRPTTPTPPLQAIRSSSRPTTPMLPSPPPPQRLPSTATLWAGAVWLQVLQAAMTNGVRRLLTGHYRDMFITIATQPHSMDSLTALAMTSRGPSALLTPMSFLITNFVNNADLHCTVHNYADLLIELWNWHGMMNRLEMTLRDVDMPSLLRHTWFRISLLPKSLMTVLAPTLEYNIPLDYDFWLFGPFVICPHCFARVYTKETRAPRRSHTVTCAICAYTRTCGIESPNSIVPMNTDTAAENHRNHGHFYQVGVGSLMYPARGPPPGGFTVPSLLTPEIVLLMAIVPPRLLQQTSRFPECDACRIGVRISFYPRPPRSKQLSSDDGQSDKRTPRCSYCSFCDWQEGTM